MNVVNRQLATQYPPEIQAKLNYYHQPINEMSLILKNIKTIQNVQNQSQQKLLNLTTTLSINYNSIYMPSISNSILSQKCSECQILSDQKDELKKQNNGLKIKIQQIQREYHLKGVQVNLPKIDVISDNSIDNIQQNLISKFDNCLWESKNPQDNETIENKDEELMQLKKQNKQYKSILKKFYLKITQNTNIFDQINVQRENLKTVLAQKDIQITQLKNSYIILEESTSSDAQNVNLIGTIQILNDKVSKITEQANNQIQNLNGKIAILELQKNEAQNKIQHLKNIQIKLLEEKNVLKQHYNQLKTNQASLITQMHQTQAKIRSIQKSSETKIKNLQKQNSGLKNQIQNEIAKSQDEIYSTIRKTERKQKQLTQKINNLQKQIYRLQERLKATQTTKNSLEQNKIKLEKMCHEHEIRMAQLEDANRQSLKRVEIITEKYKKLENKYAELESNKLLIEKQQNKLEDEAKMLKAYIQEIYSMFFKDNSERDIYENFDSLKKFKIQIRKGYRMMRFCPQSSILTQKNKLFLFENLQNFRKKEILSCKSVYNYDSFNKQNFHKYFDGRNNLLLVVKLQNAVIGGFTQYAIERNKIQRPGSGFIFSVTLEQIYLCKATVSHPVVSYDDYYLIFGNAEIRIKTKQVSLFSNFGINHCTFDQKKRKKADFLKSNETEVPILSYEIYQVEFE